MLDKVKGAIPVKTDAYNDELNALIASAKQDLRIVEVPGDMDMDPLVERAIITYCRMHFRTPENYEQLKTSYDEQKAQLSMAHGLKREWQERREELYP